MSWRVFLASATGKRHLEEGTPCQDYGCYGLSRGLFVGVVCDGAGSAPESRKGAEFVAQKLVAYLPDTLADGFQAGDLGVGASREGIETVLERIRLELAEQQGVEDELAGGMSLRDYACTLVGCVSSQRGGLFFHIGDGFAVHRNGVSPSTISFPENGEYSNETYFVTDKGWRDHLRLTPFVNGEGESLVGLMTDGSSPFVIDRDRTGFYKPFIDPVVNFLRVASESDGSHALQNLLENERTYEITSDDKTLLLAFVG